MEKISIKTSTVNIFKPVSHKHETKHTNPFGISFKGNVIQADVFDSSKVKTEEKKGIIKGISDKTRAVKSAFVGGINNFNTELSTRFNNGINKIVSFGRKIGETTKDFIKKANETYIVFDVNKLSTKIGHLHSTKNAYEVKNLLKRPVSELETMLNKEIEAKRG